MAQRNEIKLSGIYTGKELKKAASFFKTADSAIIFHHSDNDGLFAARIVSEYIKANSSFGINDVQYVNCSYRSSEITTEVIESEVKPMKNPVVIVVDFMLSYKSYLDIQALNPCGVIWLDHHISAEREFGRYSDSAVDESTLKVDTTECGTSLAYKLVMDLTGPWSDKPSWVKEMGKLVKLIKIYDINVLDSGRDAWYLNAFTYRGCVKAPGDDIITRLMYEDKFIESAISSGKKYDELNHQLNEEDFKNFGYYCDDWKGLRVYIRKGYGSGYTFNDHINEVDAVLLYHANPDGTYTYQMFSSKEGFDGSKIAESYGGGGHPHACGWSCDHDVFAGSRLISVDSIMLG